MCALVKDALHKLAAAPRVTANVSDTLFGQASVLPYISSGALTVSLTTIRPSVEGAADADDTQPILHNTINGGYYEKRRNLLYREPL
jgi:hypothetical protein